MTFKFNEIKDDRRFQSIVISIILLSSLLVGFQTYEISNNYINIVIILDYFVTVFFLFEAFSKISWGEKKGLIFQ